MEDCNRQNMLDRYIHDHLVKNNLKETAKIFMNEANVPPIPVAIDSPGGFLKELWRIGYDMYASQIHKDHEANSAERMTKIKQENPYLETRQFPILVDPTPSCVPKSAVPRTGLNNPGMNIGVGSFQLKGCSLTESERILLGLGNEALNSILTQAQLQRLQMLDAPLQQRCMGLTQELEKKHPGLGTEALKSMLTGNPLEWLQTFEIHYRHERAAQEQKTKLAMAQMMVQRMETPEYQQQDQQQQQRLQEETEQILPRLGNEALNSILTQTQLQQIQRLDAPFQQRCISLAQEIEKRHQGLGNEALKSILTENTLEWFQTFEAQHRHKLIAQAETSTLKEMTVKMTESLEDQQKDQRQQQEQQLQEHETEGRGKNPSSDGD